MRPSLSETYGSVKAYHVPLVRALYVACWMLDTWPLQGLRCGATRWFHVIPLVPYPCLSCLSINVIASDVLAVLHSLLASHAVHLPFSMTFSDQVFFYFHA